MFCRGTAAAHLEALSMKPFHAMLQGYYDEDMDSDMNESQADEEVAVTKRGRAVKLPAKYKAEVYPYTLHGPDVAERI